MPASSQLESIFFAALERTASERTAFLDSACRSDQQLRQRVERLLQVHPKAVDFLSRPIVDRPRLDADLMLVPTTIIEPTRSWDGAMLHSRWTEETWRQDCDSHAETLSILERSDTPGALGSLAHYEIYEVLGQGSFGTVLKGLDLKLDRTVAIKLMSRHLATMSVPRRRFLREARSAAAVRHENVVAIFAVGDSPIPYLVMEFVGGLTLQQRLESSEPLVLREILRTGRQIAAGLAAAHAKGLVHRDIKPSNILLEGPTQDAKLTDFGLARAVDDASITRVGVILGTPMYMAPEQVLGEAIDQRVDLFSLGSVLYAMCCGSPPFRAMNSYAVLRRVVHDPPRPIREIRPDIPERLCSIIARLHAKDPDHRFASAQAVEDELARCEKVLDRIGRLDLPGDTDGSEPRLTGESPQETDARPSKKLEKRLHLRRFSLTIMLVILLLLGGVGLGEATGVTNVRGTVVRIFMPEGTLVVQVEDPDVAIRIEGSELVIVGAGAREIRVRPGTYLVEAQKDGRFLSREFVRVTKNDRTLVRIRHEPTESEALRTPMRPVLPAQEWERSLSSLQENELRIAVAERLRILNPRFDGEVQFDVNGFDLWISGSGLSDLSAVRRLAGLQRLHVDSRDLSDISALTGLPLIYLSLGNTSVVDLSPLRGMKLQELMLSGSNRIVEISVLQGMPLKSLTTYATGVADLSPLEGSSLRRLNCSDTPVSDLSPIASLPLEALDIRSTRIKDWSPIARMPLQNFLGDISRDQDADVVRRIGTIQRINDMPSDEFWKKYSRATK